MPPALQRRLAAGARDHAGAGKVRVMLKVSGGAALDAALSVDRRKKQVTLADPSSPPPSPRPPGMFAFDAVFTDDDPPVDVCSNLLTEALHAVINGTDGCFLSFGAPLLESSAAEGLYDGHGDLPAGAAGGRGVEACAAAWLFRGVAERRLRSGARFSVRVSAVEVCGAGVARDLLQPYSGAEGEQPPGAYLREQPASQLPSELRAPSAERAAHYLAAALAARSSPAAHLVLTLHVYQYSVAGPRGAVAGGRSRLHLVEARGGKDMSLSALGSVLLAVFSGHKHLPHRDHKLTQLLKDCFSSLMCHTTVVAHVSPLSCHHADMLATLQLSARLHRIRHRKIKFFGPSVICSYKKSDSSQPTEGSDVEPSSSEQSADTVIYLGATGDATDGEHPPPHTSNLGTKDSRCLSGKISTSAKHEENKPDEVAESKPSVENGAAICGDQKPPGIKNASCKSFSARVGRSPLTRSLSPRKSVLLGEDPATLTSDEQWVDGPRIPKSRVAEALDLKEETWVDGPLQNGGGPGYGFMDEHKELMIRSWVENQTSHMKKSADARAPDGREGPTATDASERGDQKLTSPDTSTSLVPTSAVISNHIIATSRDSADRISQLNKGHSSTPETLVAYNDEVMDTNSQKSGREISIDVSTDHFDVRLRIPVAEKSSRQSPLKWSAETRVVQSYDRFLAENYDDEYEVFEVAETAEVVSMQDACLQVTEEEIAMCMQENCRIERASRLEAGERHPLHTLSEENLTTISTFTDSTSSAIGRRQSPRPVFDHVPSAEAMHRLNPPRNHALRAAGGEEQRRRSGHLGAGTCQARSPARRPLDGDLPGLCLEVLASSPRPAKQQQGRCESSGYESFPRDSECSSLASSGASEDDLGDARAAARVGVLRGPRRRVGAGEDPGPGRPRVTAPLAASAGNSPSSPSQCPADRGDICHPPSQLSAVDEDRAREMAQQGKTL